MSFAKSTETSMNDLFTTSMADSEGLLEETQSFRNGRRDVNKYMSRLQKCRDLIDQSKQILNELQRSQPPQRRRRMNELHAAEEKLNQYEAEIEQQIELFETSSARNEKLDAGVESLNRRLAELARALAADQEQSSIATTTTTLTKSQQRFESLEALEERIGDVRDELAQIEAMRDEIGRVGAEKSCLLDADVKNVSQSRHQPLLDGFNETVLDMEMRKDKELTTRLTRMSSELDSMREKCEEKLKKLLDKR